MLDARKVDYQRLRPPFYPRRCLYKPPMRATRSPSFFNGNLSEIIPNGERSHDRRALWSSISKRQLCLVARRNPARNPARAPLPDPGPLLRRHRRPIRFRQLQYRAVLLDAAKGGSVEANVLLSVCSCTLSSHTHCLNDGPRAGIGTYTTPQIATPLMSKLSKVR